MWRFLKASQLNRQKCVRGAKFLDSLASDRAGHAVTFFTEEDMPKIAMKKIANIIVAVGGEVPNYIGDFKEGIQRQPKPKQKKGKADAERKRKRAVS